MLCEAGRYRNSTHDNFDCIETLIVVCCISVTLSAEVVIGFLVRVVDLLCSWGPTWGINGTVRVAYGSASIMREKSTYAVSFGPKLPSADIFNLSKKLQQGLTVDTTRPGCLAYRQQAETRLMNLANDIITLSFYSTAVTPAASDILADVVTSNLGFMPVLSARRRGPFRLCGASGAWLAATFNLVLSTPPSPSPSQPSPRPMPSLSPSMSPRPPPESSTLDLAAGRRMALATGSYDFWRETQGYSRRKPKEGCC
jgi:hypothetical protein